MNTMNQQHRIAAALALSVHRLSSLRHAALKLALMEQHDKAHPNRERVLTLVDRWRVATPFGYYSTRPEMWRANG